MKQPDGYFPGGGISGVSNPQRSDSAKDRIPTSRLKTFEGSDPEIPEVFFGKSPNLGTPYPFPLLAFD